MLRFSCPGIRPRPGEEARPKQPLHPLRLCEYFPFLGIIFFYRNSGYHLLPFRHSGGAGERSRPRAIQSMTSQKAMTQGSDEMKIDGALAADRLHHRRMLEQLATGMEYVLVNTGLMLDEGKAAVRVSRSSDRKP